MVTCALGVQLQVFQSHQTFRGSDACFIPTRSCLLGLLLCSFFCPKVTLCSSWGYLLRCSCCQRPLITRFVLKTLDLVEPPVTCFLPRSPVLIMGLDALSGNLQLKNLNIKTSFFFFSFSFLSLFPSSVAHLHPIIRYVLKLCEQCVEAVRCTSLWPATPIPQKMVMVCE